MEGLKILTPKFREEINKGFDITIKELQECEKNALTNAQITGLKMLKNYINSLPDGILIPIRK